MTLCLDTYTLVEIHKKNPAYKEITMQEWVVTDHTLIEFYDVLSRKYDEKTASFWFERLTPFHASTPLSVLLIALKFKRKFAKENLSFFDCIGYVYAQEHGMKFVTGDKAFKGKPGVLFIK